jgi:hypothetical protein
MWCCGRIAHDKGERWQSSAKHFSVFMLRPVEDVILGANDLEAVGNDRLLDACFAWLTMSAISFVLDDESRLYPLVQG